MSFTLSLVCMLNIFWAMSSPQDTRARKLRHAQPHVPGKGMHRCSHMHCSALKDKLVEQGEAIEAALAKDPLAGRHEIIKQEHMKAARAGRNAQPHAKADSGNQRRHFSVREWQNMKHNELRFDCK